MKERPILFGQPMVRALLAGTKTQTRRMIKLPHQNPLGEWEPMPWGGPNGGRTSSGETVPAQTVIGHSRTGDIIGCPYGVPGDRLWVREAFMHEPADYCWEASVSIPSRPANTVYRADYPESQPGEGWKPSIHMPRKLSRIDLEITEIRVELLQDISEEDAVAEGAERFDGFPLTPWWHGRHGPVGPCLYATARKSYRYLWDAINGAGSWDANPWVWAVSFKRVGASVPAVREGTKA